MVLLTTHFLTDTICNKMKNEKYHTVRKFQNLIENRKNRGESDASPLTLIYVTAQSPGFAQVLQ